MPIQLFDEAPQKTTAEKLAPWLRRIIIGGTLVWICISMQTFSEDTRTHTIKITYPLLGNHERITRLEPGYDPEKARWAPVSQAFPVADGTVFFVKTGDAVYAVKIGGQNVAPEQANYAYLKVGDDKPGVVTGVAKPLPYGVELPGLTLPWTGHHNGTGFLYLDDAFIWNKPGRYEIGVPFQGGDLEQFRKAIPANVHFESAPWKIVPPETFDLVPAQ